MQATGQDTIKINLPAEIIFYLACQIPQAMPSLVHDWRQSGSSPALEVGNNKNQ